ncbi:NAD(P)/FAD-dependent oxidoreductase [Gordonia soli]|uniref:Putative oxidoreductase n=1 Tax=Gordonia soli NBRC 108243 TaxID=1223545 RepID=M0QN70_9ACTN|nr:FAD-dependent oxidoreductase [Gordonia soli]GAC70023.1 putative oxidoreductase [Gordonia soli NBRC 108243]
MSTPRIGPAVGTDRNAVVVIGGGYAGTLAANRLCGREDVDVTVVNPRPHFVERIRLHQLVADTGSAEVDYESVLNPRIRLVVDSAIRIDRTAGVVELASGERVAFDQVIYAVGSRSAVPDLPGAAEHACPLAEWEDAQRLRDRLAARPGGMITIVGGGVTGIEAAAEFAEAGHRVRLISSGPVGGALSLGGRKSVVGTLTRLGVEVVADTDVVEVQADAVITTSRTDGMRMRLASDTTVLTAGFTVPTLAADSGLAVDAVGRLLADETLTSVDDPRIVGAGDAASPSGHALRMSCQAAMPLGAHAAGVVAAHLDGVAAAPIDAAFVGHCVSLGRRRGIVQFARLDDTPIRVFVPGRLGARLKETVCSATVGALRKEGRKPGSYRGLPRKRDVAALGDVVEPARR